MSQSKIFHKIIILFLELTNLTYTLLGHVLGGFYMGIFSINFFFYRRESGEALKQVLFLTKSDIKDLVSIIQKIKRKGRGES